MTVFEKKSIIYKIVQVLVLFLKNQKLLIYNHKIKKKLLLNPKEIINKLFINFNNLNLKNN